MIIDFHTHVFPDKIAVKTMQKFESANDMTAFTDGTFEGLKRSMETHGIDMSVILPVVTKPEQFKSVNTFAAELTGNIISFGGIHPMTDNFTYELDEIKAMGLKGIKLHPDYQGVYIDDIRYLRILYRAAELGLIISIHGGRDTMFPEALHCTPRRVANVLEEIQPEKMILAHMGGWKLWDESEDYLAGRDIYFDTSYALGQMDDSQFIRMVKKHGANRIIFGTDSPWGGQGKDRKHLMDLDLPADDKEAIAWKNARDLLVKI